MRIEDIKPKTKINEGKNSSKKELDDMIAKEVK